MDLETLKTEAAEETTRFFLKKDGFSPDPESDEWQEEYRRQFASIKARRPAVGAAGAKPGKVGTPAAVALPPLRGDPAQARWAAARREERLEEIRSPEMRAWVARSWLSAKEWLDTGDLPMPAFLRRVEAQYGDYRRQALARAELEEAERTAKASAAAALTAKIVAAGITAEGLVELIDVSSRVKPVAPKDRLADLHVGERRLRVFETASPLALLVIESTGGERSEYGIESDEGLVASLKLFSEAGGLV